MDVSRLQERIDAIDWYHEFDFGKGLKTQSKSAIPHGHHRIWKFIEQNLATIDFRDKTVLDVGCWDGYWSFYAERQGARSVLATDDRSQNWSDGSGLTLARELLGSRVEINQDLSIHQLASLNRKFDIIFVLGVYYHLVDPFHALTQIRHCCHPDTLVLIEGDVDLCPPANAITYDLSDRNRAIFVPTPEALNHLLQGAYLAECSRAFIGAEQPTGPVDRFTWWHRLRFCIQTLTGSRSGLRSLLDDLRPRTRPVGRIGWQWRLRSCAHALTIYGSKFKDLEWMTGQVTREFIVCRPFQGVNPRHVYKPPFGLDAYDDRFQSRAAA
jgi:tRNA (mo5U34)-methyltransferase